MIQFANISRKRMLQQSFSGHFVKAADLLAITLSVLTQKTVRQRHDVFAPVT